MAQTNPEEPVTFLMPSPPFPANTRLAKRTTTKQGATANAATKLAWRKVESCLTSKNYNAECKTAFAQLQQAATAVVPYAPSYIWVSFRTQGEDYKGLEVSSQITDFQGWTSVRLTYEHSVIRQRCGPSDAPFIFEGRLEQGDPSFDTRPTAVTKGTASVQTATETTEVA